ncbi:hypothetical protein [Spartinivicinus poritis]|uniref:Uncharacterized protein n=1 Tax=Spartinivicinus poritis TaxID=2994640 RepID=A0ABT5UEI9_9GAMM|nr:hypothetical protein [Spartinivicinus sp. A2-2]MDE1464794.1 hypothetical protein [Spartinivicinus sp. A2-2]
MQRPFKIEPQRLALTIAYQNKKLIADQVLPRTPVGSEIFKYSVFAPEQFLTVPELEVSRRGVVNEVEFTGDETESSTKDYGLETSVPESDVEEAPEHYDPIDIAVESTTDLVLLGREKRVADIVFDPANHGITRKLKKEEAFNNADAPMQDYLMALLDEPLIRPNKMVLGRAQWTAIRKNKALVKARNANSGDSGMISRQELADLLEIDEVIIGEAFLNIAVKGQKLVLKKIWSDHCAFLHIDQLATSQNNRITYGFTAQRKQRSYREWFDENIGVDGGTRVRVYEKLRELIVAKDCGILLQDVLQPNG